MKKFKAHILVVDDDDRIRDLVKQYLNDNDYLVTTAINAEDAQNKVNIIKFDLIVLDIMMPGKSGLDFTIENKNEIPKELSKSFNNYIFGCDICQDVCPWNKFSTSHNEREFLPKEELSKMSKKDWQELTHETFNKIFKNSAVKRTKFQGLKRNIKAVS